MKPYSPFAALSYRNFRLFWFGQLISLIGTWMHMAAQGWLVFTLTDSPFFLGLAGTASTSPILLFTLAGGVIADRYPKRHILLSAHILLMVLTLILATLVASETVTIWHVLILAFMIGSVFAIEIPTRQSFLIEMVGRGDLLNAIALNSSSFHSARMIGPAIAGFIMGTLGLAPCFFINAASYLAIITALLMMRFDHRKRDAGGRGVLSEFREGISYLFHHESAYLLLIMVGIISFFGLPYISFLPVYARDILQTGEKGLGILMGCAGAGALTGAARLALRGNSSNKGIIMAIAGTVFSIALLTFSMSETLWLSYLMIFIMGAGAVSQIATANTVLQLSVPDKLRGRVMSAFTTMFLGLAPLGNFTVGSLAHYVGTQTALFTSACFCLAGTVMVMACKPRILRL